VVRVTYSHRLNAAGIRALIASPQGGIAQDLLLRAKLVETQAKRNIAGGPSGPKRIDTGRLRSSILGTLIMRNGEPVGIVGTNVKYARWVHDGTGIYGPRGQVIRPVRAKFLRFKAGGRVIYRRQVKGMRPNRFLLFALSAARR
jgi:hypothetical protein